MAAGPAEIADFDRLTLPEVNRFIGAALGDGHTTIDLSSLQKVDSSALAALLAIARKAPRGCQFVNPPASLVNLARLYGVDKLLFTAG